MAPTRSTLCPAPASPELAELVLARDTLAAEVEGDLYAAYERSSLDGAEAAWAQNVARGYLPEGAELGTSPLIAAGCLPHGGDLRRALGDRSLDLRPLVVAAAPRLRASLHALVVLACGTALRPEAIAGRPVCMPLRPAEAARTRRDVVALAVRELGRHVTPPPSAGAKCSAEQREAWARDVVADLRGLALSVGAPLFVHGALVESGALYRDEQRRGAVRS